MDPQEKKELRVYQVARDLLVSGAPLDGSDPPENQGSRDSQAPLEK